MFFELEFLRPIPVFTRFVSESETLAFLADHKINNYKKFKGFELGLNNGSLTQCSKRN